MNAGKRYNIMRAALSALQNLHRALRSGQLGVLTPDERKNVLAHIEAYGKQFATHKQAFLKTDYQHLVKFLSDKISVPRIWLKVMVVNELPEIAEIIVELEGLHGIERTKYGHQKENFELQTYFIFEKTHSKNYII